MKRLFVPPERLSQRVALAPDQVHYLRDVLRLSPGEELEVFDGRGGAWRARFEGAFLRLGEELPRAASALDVILAQALAKGEKMDLVVQKATELGASRVVPLLSERAVVRLDVERGASRAARWRRIAQEAARQCGRSEVPEIDEPAGWERVFALLREGPERRGLLLDPEERSLRLGEAARGAPRLLIAVGPEGGFSPQESELALREGLVAVGFGSRVLRTETAGLAALAVALHVHGELG